jgi:hypothetical protein
MLMVSCEHTVFRSRAHQLHAEAAARVTDALDETERRLDLIDAQIAVMRRERGAPPDMEEK